ncbi:hypothetical protein P4O66_004645, partial [Electrophorus voltai]
CTEDTVSTDIHTSLTHLEDMDSYVPVLFTDYSSAVNTVTPTKLTETLTTGLTPSFCKWG